MLQVKFKKLNAEAKLPIKGSSSAACFDVYATSVEVNNGVATYKLGFATEIPEGWRGVVVPRSNISKHPWVMANSIGIIDSDYRGEWMVKYRCVSGFLEAVPYGAGDRIAQIYFEKNTDVQFVEVESLDESERGEGGFGSTGINYVTNATANVKINTNN